MPSIKTNSTIAIIGRPNVGKSTLFNRLVGQRRAVVEDFPGTTRDRLYGEVEWNGLTMNLVDTGGMVADPKDHEINSVITKGLLSQVKTAIFEADLLLFVIDGQSHLTSEDYEAIALVRKAAKPIVLAVNKLDDVKHFDRVGEFYKLGLGEPIPISSLNGKGTGDLLDRITKTLADLGFARNITGEQEEDQIEKSNRDQEITPPAPSYLKRGEREIKVAIVGRPNVGKSTLVNALCGEERVIVSDIPGTTRDAIDVDLEFQGQHFTLIDTAGIRRRGKVEKGIEKYSVLRAQQAIDRADVVLLLIDPTEGLTSQDTHIMGYIDQRYKSMALVVNKWDAIKEKSKKENVKLDEVVRDYTRDLETELSFVKYAPVITISALTGMRVPKLFDLVSFLHQQRLVRLTDKQLRDVIKPALSKRQTPVKRSVALRFYSFHQTNVAPPTFEFVVNRPEQMHFSFERYLKNSIRLVYPFEGCQLKFVYKKKK